MMKVWQPTTEEIKKTDNWGTWKKEISEFDWYYEEPETCFIIKGEASVTDNSGNTISFKSGDMVEFKNGLKCKWKINKEIEKRYKFG
jgi:uncharacterized protein